MSLDFDEDGVIRVNPNTVFLRTAYNYDMNAAGDETGIHCKEPTMAKQEFKEECDINTIIDRFGIGQEMPQNVQMPLTSDFMETMDYREALHELRRADEAFMQYPAHIRERFGNDPARFIDFAVDPANAAQCAEWGLNRPVEAPPAVMKVEVVSQEKTPEKA